ncbi:DEAD/DEAH box helicase family protein [Parvularcula flava]|uniref:DEAD/DEAH box helicase family protein n=1 Tax=Aquisalinus luteolus TaxID=1566827 RepID=A0A8J3A754_9PROT|nr:DEAD/DEAH box helicase family protein [Aquisalinus luteolus]NHK29673.1 DEAD/DEAH box helicase family protein [Aquisalinus luteolus]GGI02147.1 type III restriction endonuclease subunit R [Aquisalinus luteolus]
MTPEEEARHKIDKLLIAAGWEIQDRKDFDRTAALGVAVREFALGRDEADYLLFVRGKAAGVIEAKKIGTTLSGVSEQSDRYMAQLPDHLARWQDTLVFDYESTGEETIFKDMRDPHPRSRRVFAFHKPETLLKWLEAAASLRARLEDMPALLTEGLRDCQIEAIDGLEKSLAEARPRSLIQMATGAGKTFTACSSSWRLLKHAGAKRILFLVDRANLGRQTLKEFQEFEPPGAGNLFTDVYITQHLRSPRFDPDAKVVITTIQRLYSMLRGEELEEGADEQSGFETWEVEDGDIKPVAYNPDIPIETFDFIITDECHRSIYGLWRQVLDYFDAFIIGLTATPTNHTLGFFNQNLVAEYPYERSVADGVNVGYEVFRVRTKIGDQGSLIDKGYTIPVRDKRTRATRYRELEDDFDYSQNELDRSVTARNQIRTVLETYRQSLFTELFPDRSGEWVPKTLIFAKDDNHAEEIVTIVREVFGKGNEFAKKITYKTSEDPQALIKAFRVDPFPRIAVTVDMIATGTDIKPVEVVIFMRDVKSSGYFEQMKGRGVRTIDDGSLAQVTPDAGTKTRFILIDAVGVTESCKSASQPMERKRALGFDKLLEQIAQGRRDEDAISSLAARLAALDRKIEKEDSDRITAATGGDSLRALANRLLDSIDPDVIKARTGSFAGEEAMAEIAERLQDEACRPFNNPKTRQLLIDIKTKADIVIDEISPDETVSASFDLREAQKRITSFKAFIEENRDEITALQILYNQPVGRQRLTYAQIRELTAKLADPPHYLQVADVWQAYRRIEEAKVRGAPADRLLTEVVALVRFALGQIDLLEPISVQVERRFNLWIGRQKKAGIDYAPEQMEWLMLIRDHIAANAEIAASDLMQSPAFSDRGGVVKARALFGQKLTGLLDEMTEALGA